MLTKKSLIDRLKKDPMYRDALKMAPSDAERRRIIATAEGFLTQFVDGLTPVAGKLQQDPALASQLLEALKSGAPVIKESDGMPIVEPEKPE